ncbi:hypothetical protein M0812_26648 [Anaeramoeba flamelloides]|nr:hypothetical protein M0812_26648 [Anaeramoeba flamelloides]
MRRIERNVIQNKYSLRKYRANRRRNKEIRYVLLLTTEKKNIPRNNIKESLTYNLENIKLTTRLVQNGKSLLQITELFRYDLIFFYSALKATINDSVTLGNQLASYVSDGGSLIICAVAALALDKGQEKNNKRNLIKSIRQKSNNQNVPDFTYKTTYLKGKIMEKGFLPAPKGVLLNGMHKNTKRAKINLKKCNLNHPIMKNIKQFDGGRLSFRVNSQTIPASSIDKSEKIQEIAQWNDGLPLISIRKKNPIYGDVCILNMCPVSGGKLGLPGSWMPSSDGKLLISNTIKFLIEN